MASKPKSLVPAVPVEYVSESQKEFVSAIEKDPLYSLEPDPEGKLGFSEEEKNFTRWFIQYHNIGSAASMSGIDYKAGSGYYADPKCQNEIRRISLALYKRKFAKRLLTIDEIGGYLTSVLIDDDVPEADRLKPKEKLEVAQMIIDLNQMKTKSFESPDEIESVDIEHKIEGLDVNSIKKLISDVKAPNKDEIKKEADEKEGLIEQIAGGTKLDPSEIAYLRTCTPDELKKLITSKPADPVQK
jgi:hypothetical protein